MVFSFGYGICTLYGCFHLGMMFSFRGYGVFIWVCSFYLGMVFSFGYGLFIKVFFIRIWCFHLAFHSGMYGLFIWVIDAVLGSLSLWWAVLATLGYFLDQRHSYYRLSTNRSVREFVGCYTVVVSTSSLHIESVASWKGFTTSGSTQGADSPPVVTPRGARDPSPQL